MSELYRDYFDIDPEYFPVVNASVIAEHPDLWTKFYPHDSFVNLINSLVNTINRKNKLSVWVEGAYGTGKSHAVLTAKKLLDESDEAVKLYFDRYSDKLSHDLYNRLCAVKNGPPILTVHRYGCDEIETEQDLLYALQESIAQALTEKGFAYGGDSSLRDTALRWLENDANRMFLNTIMTKEYPEMFGGENVDGFIQKLKAYTGTALGEIIGKMMKVARIRGIRALSLTREDVINWVKDVIKNNGLKAIVFFWDEFTEYFRNNQNRLTTFQTLVEMSESDEAPMYLIPVTHDVGSLFPQNTKDKNNEWSKIKGRFYEPFCTITLPENIAFDLMGKALEKKSDAMTRQLWNNYAEELYDRTHSSRAKVQKAIGLTEKELKDVVPVHPFAALLLKYISSAFASDARSMFSFIKDDAGDEYRGFQWFIDNYGPLDVNPLLTIDMLWDFFYEKGKSQLAPDVRRVLDAYGRATDLKGDEPQVLKTVLLMQAIRDKGGNTGRLAELMAPTSKNLDLVFEGTELENGQAKKIADSLVRKNILYVKPGTDEYAVGGDSPDEAEIQKIIDSLQATLKTSDLLEEATQGADDPFRLSGALACRYDVKYVTAENYSSAISAFKNANMGVQLPLIVGFARNQMDAHTISKIIADEANKPDNHTVFVDASGIQLGNDRISSYIDSKARQQYWLKKRGEQADQYGKNQKDILKEWRNAMGKNELLVYIPGSSQPQRVTKMNLAGILQTANRQAFPSGLETIIKDTTDTMWTGNNQWKSGAGLGAGNGKPLSQFSCMAKGLGAAWTTNPYTEKYWETDPLTPISKIKIYLNGIIEQAFETGDRIAIGDIYQALTHKPYGFMPVNATAFVIGFLLREYTNGSYSASDGIQTSKLDVDMLQSMVEKYMKHIVTPDSKYKDQYIVRMTREIKAFMEGSSVVFGREVRQARMEDVRNGIVRPGMKTLAFPMRCLLFDLDDITEDKRERVRQLIELYAALANDGGIGSRSAEDVAKEIGIIFLNDSQIAEVLHRIMNAEHSRKGMQNYVRTFENGALINLSTMVGDHGEYLNALQARFKSDEYKWLWHQDTIDNQIRLVIQDYKIIQQTNTALRARYNSFGECIEGWINVCKHIHIGCLSAKNFWQDLKPLMDMLYDLKRAGALPDNQREKFLDLITNKADAFWSFVTSGQEEMFARVCAMELDGHDIQPSDIADIYKRLNIDCFAMDVQSYRELVKKTIANWKQEQIRIVLLNAWKEAAHCDSPRDWSERYTMPILCMVSAQDEIDARKAFNTINSAVKYSPDETAANAALSFIQTHSDFFACLDDSETRDKAFRESVIGKNDVLLSVGQVKEHLRKKLIQDPYDWYKLSAAQSEVEKLAQYEYEGPGFAKASEIVDEMDAATVKKYLKNLIEKNKTVGIEILREKNQRG